MVIWDFSRDGGGLTKEQIDRAKVILWKGHCHVHTKFNVDHVQEFRNKYPMASIIVHPECREEVVHQKGEGHPRSY